MNLVVGYGYMPVMPYIHIIHIVNFFCEYISKLDLNQNLCGVTIGWSE